MRSPEYTRLAARSLSGSWLASRLGIEPRRLEAMRRAGELVAVRPKGAYADFYPAWQLGPDAKPHPALPRLIAAARQAGLDEARLDALMTARRGIAGPRRRLVDDLREGHEERVIAAIRSSTI